MSKGAQKQARSARGKAAAQRARERAAAERAAARRAEVRRRALIAGGAIPFVDIGNRYVVTGAQYLPSTLANMTWAEVAAAMRDPSSQVAIDIDGAANMITATICKLTHGQPAGVCNSAAVKAAAGSI
jgi:hypothetical protein